MNTLIEQGTFGIITGILTTVILYLIKILWSEKVVPFLTSTRYRGVIIDGEWEGFSENENIESGELFKSNFNLFLIQNAHDLKGTFLFKYESEKNSFNINFNVTGYIWEGYVTLNFTPNDRRVTSYATSLLKLHDGGISLVGSWLFRNVINEHVSQVPLVLMRKKQINQ